jgi:signal transduction histidine kinase
LDQPGVWLATLPATAQQRRRTFAAVAVLFAALFAVAPFAKVPLPEGDGFIPFVQAVIVVTDLTTAVLLFTQFSLLRARALLALANIYLFTALIVFVHTLTFPRAFAPQGLLVVSQQTTGWLFLIWHFSFSAGVIAYVLLNDNAGVTSSIGSSPRAVISGSIVGVTALVCAILWFLTAADRLIPLLFIDRLTYSPAVFYIGVFNTVVAGIALVLLLIRKGSMLDQWLTVSVGAMATQVAMTTFFSGGRFDLGWYSFRIFGVVSSTAVLLGLLSESTRLYAKLSIALRTLQRERENKLMSVEAVVAALAHEVRQPLTGMTANAAAGTRFLDRASPDIVTAKTLFDQIKGAADRANEVFENVLRLFRGGRQDHQPLDINVLALEAVQLLRTELDDNNIVAHTMLESELPTIQGNRGQLREVILNLAQNSIEAMATTTKQRVISIVSASHTPDSISISLQDTGPGIDPHTLASIFDPFVTTKPKGTGLGLAICRMIIDQHGGKLSATSDTHFGGARFEITLPTKIAEPFVPGTAMAQSARRE